MSEEGFHEIQLNGKQLVFLFIATTVVAVVIFLCGVLVGRGVRAEAAEAEAQAAPAMASAAEPALADPTPPAAQATVDASTPPPQPVNDELSYYSRLGDKATPEETLRAPDRSEVAASTTTSAPPAPKPSAAPASPGAADFSIQVAALRDQSDATALVQRLKGKGYQAFVVEPFPAGSSAVYRVRVGAFKTRRAAEAVARRLEQEEKFKPWIIR